MLEVLVVDDDTHESLSGSHLRFHRSNSDENERRTDSSAILVVTLKGDCGHCYIGILLGRKNFYDDVISGDTFKSSRIKSINLALINRVLYYAYMFFISMSYGRSKIRNILRG